MAFRFFFAASESYIDLLRAEGVKRVLLSYAAVKKEPRVLEAYDGLDVLLDSGAWSVFTGIMPPIDVREFINWHKSIGFPFVMQAGPDVIGDPVASYDNWRRCVDAGLDVFPTWHAGESLELLGKYAEAAPRVAIGGMAGRGARGIVADVVAHAATVVDLQRCHLFGVSLGPHVIRFRPGSVDASSWINGAQYGNICVPQPSGLRQVSVGALDARYKVKASLETMKHVHRFGFTVQRLRESWEDRLRFNARAFLEFENMLNAVGGTP